MDVLGTSGVGWTVCVCMRGGNVGRWAGLWWDFFCVFGPCSLQGCVQVGRVECDCLVGASSLGAESFIESTTEWIFATTPKERTEENTEDRLAEKRSRREGSRCRRPATLSCVCVSRVCVCVRARCSLSSLLRCALRGGGRALPQVVARRCAKCVCVCVSTLLFGARLTDQNIQVIRADVPLDRQCVSQEVRQLL